MRGSVLEVRTTADGSVVIAPHGAVGLDKAVELRQVLVHTVRRVRPLRLILDLTCHEKKRQTELKARPLFSGCWTMKRSVLKRDMTCIV